MMNTNPIIGSHGMLNRRIHFLTLIFIMLVAPYGSGCKKFVEVDSITDKLLTTQVFSSDANANTAIAGIYRTLKTNIYTGSSFTVYTGIAADELYNFSPSTTYDDYKNNTLQASNTSFPWTGLYNVIYSCNLSIEQMQSSTAMSAVAKSYYEGEAEYIRALCYFYLVNLYGDVPLLTTSDITVTATASRSSITAVYGQIVSDLLDAQARLGNDYSFTGGDKTRANKWAATALLARVYLYQQDWANAETQSSLVIGSGSYSLLAGPSGILQKNNNEAIFQIANNTTDINYDATYFIFTTSPSILCTSYLISAFETGDLRRAQWIRSGTYSGGTYYYPYKFTSTVAGSSELFTFSRLAEVYLIRSEARAEQNNIGGAQTDLNIIRRRAGLANTTANDQPTMRSAIEHERQVELFAEGGQRWFDMKRTGRINVILSAEKPATWRSTAALWPIPLSDIQKDPNLVQNAGY